MTTLVKLSIFVRKGAKSNFSWRLLGIKNYLRNCTHQIIEKVLLSIHFHYLDAAWAVSLFALEASLKREVLFSEEIAIQIKYVRHVVFTALKAFNLIKYRFIWEHHQGFSFHCNFLTHTSSCFRLTLHAFMHVDLCFRKIFIHINVINAHYVEF